MRRSKPKPLLAGALAALLAVSLASCSREERRFREDAAPPGEAGPASYEGNAWAVSEGKQLFHWFNCAGCHAQGGGGMGPPLMDAKWIYGASFDEIVRSILDGRPNGMPSFRARLSDPQAWQLAAYVRALSGQLRFDVPASRNDHMQAKPSELQMEREQPRPG